MLFETTGAPAGFDELASEREAVVDVYFGGRKIGEARALTKPGSLQFRSAQDLLAKLPQVIPSPALSAAFASDLATNANLVCSKTNATQCGLLTPATVGIIYDEDHFRVDVFVNPKFLRVSQSVEDGYLPVPTAPLGLTNALGLAASGAIGGRTAYNIQNRTVVAVKNARIRANSSIASDLGLVVDDLVGEVDHKDLRYSAGLFWTPGNDFVGQRRIIGAGVGTQFDTRIDQETLYATPLIVFLAQPARVEVLVDGRLISARSYAAGNNAIDTSAMSEGSYSVLLRIHEANGAVREERRFFAKNSQVPPLQHPIFYAFGGVLANTRKHQPISPSDTFYYQAGSAVRLGNNFAIDGAVLGTQHKAIAQAGGWLIKRQVRLRVAGLLSSDGDTGALLQASSSGTGPLNINFDLRRIWSHDDKPLIPLPSYADTFGSTAPTGLQLASGSYTQATGSVGLRLGEGYVSIVGSYRKDRKSRADYTIGPSISWPVVNRSRVQVVLEASAQKTRTTTAAFAGARVLFTSGRMSMLNSFGRSVQGTRDDGQPTVSRATGVLNAHYSFGDDEGTLIDVDGGLDRNIDSSTAHAGTNIYSDRGTLRADVLRNLEGGGGTQYNLSLQSGVAFTAHEATFGARNPEQSAIVVSVAGDETDAQFKVMVDDVQRGRIKAGQRLSLFVAGYRRYRIRLVPIAAAPVSIDSAVREVTLYPGNVQTLVWRAESYFTLFAQAMSRDGVPIRDALVQSAKGIAETDSNGYFQIDVRRSDPITIARNDGAPCVVKLAKLAVANNFASIGKVICQ
jgi:outer membrane usher protein FimD/PapC